MDIRIIINYMFIIFLSIISWKIIMTFLDFILNGHKGKGRKAASAAGFNTAYRFSVHAAIFDNENKVLLLKQSYGDKRWGLPGGGVEPGETVYEAIKRECREELGLEVNIESFTGIYYHKEFNSQVGIFRCSIKESDSIKLSEEHTEYVYRPMEELGEVQRFRVQNALTINAEIASKAF